MVRPDRGHFFGHFGLSRIVRETGARKMRNQGVCNHGRFSDENRPSKWAYSAPFFGHFLVIFADSSAARMFKNREIPRFLDIRRGRTDFAHPRRRMAPKRGGVWVTAGAWPGHGPGPGLGTGSFSNFGR